MSSTTPQAAPPDRAIDFDQAGCLPMPDDNAAIAIRDLEAGTRFRFRGETHKLSHSVLEGHRFAVAAIAAGETLLSWGLPFGRALRSIRPGDYLCNAGMLSALHVREPEFPLPEIANFQNAAATFELDEAGYRAGEQVPPYEEPGTFRGFLREGGRGTGTRNFIVILGTSSSAASFARRLAATLEPDAEELEQVDGIVAVAHTEGSGPERPNNLDFVLRTLAGFLVHPNVGAVLAVDMPGDYLDNRRLRAWAEQNDYPLEHVPHAFFSLAQDLAASERAAADIVRGWYGRANAAARRERPLSELKIALQCGGSDAFSGVSGNPLAGWVAREVIRHGGAASLAETDELIGAEPYILANTRSLEVTKQFLDRIAVFRERIAWHGHSAEGNPSGGNLFRGLYNISLKSIGAARKKAPDVRLDHVIGYSERMRAPGFHFMDSPGNDLESIAGQVASGCNLIFFITGNGSITNFPFVPTIKFVTTTRRWDLLSKDMDVNAGRYQDGERLEDLGMETFGYAVRAASGEPTAGERAGHSQVSIWRNWRQTDGTQLQQLRRASEPDGQPVDLPAVPTAADLSGLRAPPAGTLGLILPTSLCSGQIALRIANELNARVHGGAQDRLFAGRARLTRFVALPHTEGCGASSGENEEHFLRTAVGHLVHPAVGAALLLEHGCERTHNDLMRHTLKRYGVDPRRFGFASIQLDGGIEAVTAKVTEWFAGRALRESGSGEDVQRPLAVGLLATGPVPAFSARVLSDLVAGIVLAGGTAVIPHSASLLRDAAFLERLGLDDSTALRETLAYGEVAEAAGLHVMAAPAANPVEAITGLGGAGVDLVLAHVDGAPLQGHPMIPTLQAASGTTEYATDLDLVLDGSDRDLQRLVDCIRATLQQDYAPRAWMRGFTDFQLTRGYLGVSL